jgi:hypothetical protein
MGPFMVLYCPLILEFAVILKSSQICIQITSWHCSKSQCQWRPTFTDEVIHRHHSSARSLVWAMARLCFSISLAGNWFFPMKYRGSCKKEKPSSDCQTIGISTTPNTWMYSRTCQMRHRSSIDPCVGPQIPTGIVLVVVFLGFLPRDLWAQKSHHCLDRRVQRGLNLGLASLFEKSWNGNVEVLHSWKTGWPSV